MSDVKYSTNNFGIDGFKDDLFDNFVVWHGSCEQDESVSIASQIIEKTDDVNVLKKIYTLLKQFEKEHSEDALSAIRTRESFLENPNTPTECIIDISESNLQYDYMFEYYGGFGGDDYKVYTNLATKVKDNLLTRNIKEKNPNLEYFLKIYEIEECKEQIQIAFENGDIESELQMREKHNVAAEELNILAKKKEEYLSQNNGLNTSPSIDECLQQIEEEEAAKQNIKSPSF